MLSLAYGDAAGAIRFVMGRGRREKAGSEPADMSKTENSIRTALNFHLKRKKNLPRKSL